MQGAAASPTLNKANSIANDRVSSSSSLSPFSVTSASSRRRSTSANFKKINHPSQANGRLENPIQRRNSRSYSRTVSSVSSSRSSSIKNKHPQMRRQSRTPPRVVHHYKPDQRQGQIESNPYRPPQHYSNNSHQRPYLNEQKLINGRRRSRTPVQYNNQQYSAGDMQRRGGKQNGHDHRHPTAFGNGYMGQESYYSSHNPPGYMANHVRNNNRGNYLEDVSSSRDRRDVRSAAAPAALNRNNKYEANQYSPPLRSSRSDRHIQSSSSSYYHNDTNIHTNRAGILSKDKNP